MLLAANGVAIQTEFESGQKASGLTICRSGFWAAAELKEWVAPFASHLCMDAHACLFAYVRRRFISFCQNAKDAGFEDVYATPPMSRENKQLKKHVQQ